jgi:hypothetical protein
LYIVLHDFEVGALPLIVCAVFANWLFVRYRAFFGGMKKALKSSVLDLFLFCLLIVCLEEAVSLASESFRPEFTRGMYYKFAARALIPASLFFAALLVGTKRLLPRALREMCRDFGSGIAAKQFYVTSLLYCALFTMLWKFPVISRFMYFSLGFGARGGWLSAMVVISGAIVFLNCKILDRFRGDLKSSNVALASWLCIRVCAAAFLVPAVICGLLFPRRFLFGLLYPFINFRGALSGLFGFFATGHVYTVPLLSTLVIEGATAYAFGYRTRRELGNALLCSLITHPAFYLTIGGLYAVFGNAFLNHRGIYTAALEIIVILLEYCILMGRLPEKRAQNAKLAISMNLISYIAGVLIYEAMF